MTPIGGPPQVFRIRGEPTIPVIGRNNHPGLRVDLGVVTADDLDEVFRVANERLRGLGRKPCSFIVFAEPGDALTITTDDLCERCEHPFDPQRVEEGQPVPTCADGWTCPECGTARTCRACIESDADYAADQRYDAMRDDELTGHRREDW